MAIFRHNVERADLIFIPVSINDAPSNIVTVARAGQYCHVAFPILRAIRLPKWPKPPSLREAAGGDQRYVVVLLGQIVKRCV